MKYVYRSGASNHIHMYSSMTLQIVEMMYIYIYYVLYVYNIISVPEQYFKVDVSARPLTYRRRTICTKRRALLPAMYCVDMLWRCMGGLNRQKLLHGKQTEGLNLETFRSFRWLFRQPSRSCNWCLFTLVLLLKRVLSPYDWLLPSPSHPWHCKSRACDLE